VHERIRLRPRASKNTIDDEIAIARVRDTDERVKDNGWRLVLLLRGLGVLFFQGRAGASLYAEERLESVVKRWANATSRLWYVDVYPNARRKVTRHVAEGGIRIRNALRGVLSNRREARRTVGRSANRSSVHSFIGSFVRVVKIEKHWIG